MDSEGPGQAMAEALDEDPPAYYTMYPATPSKETGRSECPRKESLMEVEARDDERRKHQGISRETKDNLEKQDSTGSGGKNDTEDKQEETRLRRRKSTRCDITRTTREMMVQASGMTQGVREALIDFCGKTTAHGFSHVVKKRQPHLLRLFWLLVTLTGLVLLVSACYDMTYNALVTRRPSTEVIYHDMGTTGIRVPFMTVCSLSGFWKSKLRQHNVSNTLASYLLLAVRGTDVISPFLQSDPRRMELLKDELNCYLQKNNLTLTQMITILSPTCEDVIVGCFSPTSQRYSVECCHEMFQPTITPLGLCYSTLREGPILNQSIAGLIGGHRIIFAINNHEYMDYDPNVVSLITLAEAGIHVSLSNFEMTASVATNMQAFRIAPNTAASIALSVSMLDRTEHYLSVWPWATPACVTEQEFWGMGEEGRANTENNYYFYTFYRTCPLALTNCSTLAFRFTNDSTAECMPADLLHHKNIESKMRECVWYHFLLNSSENMLCQCTSITQQQSFTTLVKETLQAQEGISILPNVTMSMMNIYYTQLGYTEYKERIPTIFTWFSE
ncbi:uncharacterized protein [Panulirus ornatus]|uniref:uncharacterized protein isoform X2 n=1 Tax=Panulirus ornatus TaxID=150431 RepID=UPI003A85D872